MLAWTLPSVSRLGRRPSMPAEGPTWCKGYAERYATDGRRIVKVGMGFSVEKRAMTEYIIS